ncbi:type II secretion system protein N [Maricaulis virginensis]|uniref:type II secretion system protein N n=1 Tax=Maricaulis virginensis TaxID=144022 RepID=UPI0022F26AD3|nr:type II secretion system protein N [Maricaulis virginensis]
MTHQSQSLPAGRGGRSRLPRGLATVLALAELVLLAGLTYIAARLIWLIAFGASATDFQQDPAGAGPRFGGAPAYQADLDQLAETDLFADRRAGPVDATPVAATIQETSLDLTLRGIRRGATPETGGAIIQIPGGRQSFFGVGAEVLDGVTLEEVHVDHVLIRRRGIAESLFLRDEDMPRAAGAPAAAGGQSVAGLFHAEPVREGNRLTGYRVSEASPALLSATGLRNGDVITAVDGRSAADISDLPALFRRLREEDGFTLSINRGGLPLTLQVDLP